MSEWRAMSTTSDCLEDRAAAWRDWLDEQSEAQAALEVELDEVDLAAFGLAALDEAVDKGLDSISRKVTRKSAALTTEIAALRRQFGALDVERRRNAEEAAAAQKRIASLEADGETLRASLAEAIREVAEMRYEIARDRAWHKMIEERKFAPVTEVIAIEQARRRTQAAIEGTG